MLLATAGTLGSGSGAARADATEACRPLAVAPLHDVAGYLLVPVGIDGQPFQLVLDTGAEAGLLDAGVRRTLGLPISAGQRATLHGTGGGSEPAPVARVPRLALGNLLVTDALLPVGRLPASPNVSPPVAGLLGGDVLSRFAVLIDVPDGGLAFYRDAPGCGAAAPAAGWSAVALARDGTRRTVAATLDGDALTALLDTGARSRILATRAALDAGVAPATLAAEPGGVTSGIEGRDAIYHWHRFRTLRIGDETETGPVLTVTPLAGPAGLLLGADWFARRRVLISYATDRMFIERVR